MLTAMSPLILHASPEAENRIPPAEVLQRLKAGNERFVADRPDHPHAGAERLRLAGAEDQGKHAIATVVACSDSRAPVELIFDAGVMDLFVVRIAGNVCGSHELATIEYGLAHVHTPLLVMLGHTCCGAVTAATQRMDEDAPALERNLPGLLDDIAPAVERAQDAHPGVIGDALIPFAIEENLWLGIERVLFESPAIRQLVKAGKTGIVAGIYDLASGRIDWQSDLKVDEIMRRVERNPDRATEAMAQRGIS